MFTPYDARFHFSAVSFNATDTASRAQRMRDIHTVAHQIRSYAVQTHGGTGRDYPYSACLSEAWAVYRAQVEMRRDQQARYERAMAARRAAAERQTAIEQTRREATEKAINVDIEYNSYNPRRYSRPWGATVEDGDLNFRAGTWNGTPSEGGYVRINCQPCSIIATGIKDSRRGNGTEIYYYFVKADGTLGERMSRADALYCSAI